MEKKEYQTRIAASRNQVWEVLWGENTYPQWTAAFSEGSKVETTWEEGDKVLFLNGENEGMVSRIREKKVPERMVFEHLGMVDKTGKEDTESEKVKEWAGSKEIYDLEEQNGETVLKVTMDTNEEYKDFFDNTWPKAFEKLRQLSE
ncbi:SRPBCC domain-containing protein [Antarcticibacterium flavum]|uniref:SRPBCC domain-containing protein n=1 Tax=Antarcticibacterium flavum TaxID=2058175 RepID=A0A5B7WYI2_9FLAO|nr:MULTISPECIES: SRPBCC domain-containing protein [Antarcticibacterium]MCM4158923.1 ATPase [Antarcticibacterium sp. W02-3]QCY68179.1 SRPBCC domain-containing protein [Antarcticibacterium flavum]